LSLRQAGGLV